jgi:predicted nicotinamide N-methyase
LSRATNPAALEASLSRRFRVVETRVQVADHSLAILHPANAEDLISEKDFEQDERLPYWAELWPSSRVLGEWLLAKSGEGRSLLELGCGAGLVATCASLAGFDVVVSDYYEDAVRFAQVNAWRNGARTPRAILLDWRNLGSNLTGYDVVVASDVLYERPYGSMVAKALAATLAGAGVAWIADPGRVARDTFVRALGPLHLELTGRTKLPFTDGSIRQTITILEVRRHPSERATDKSSDT